MWLTDEHSFEVLPSGRVFLCLVGFYHILPPDEHARSASPAYLAHSINPAAQPDLVFSHSERSAREKALPSSSLGMHLNQAAGSSQHIGAEVQLFGTFCYFTKNLLFGVLHDLWGAFPGALLCAVHVLLAAIKPVLWIMNCDLQLQTVCGQLQKHFTFVLEIQEKHEENWNGGGFLLTCAHASMLIIYLLD